MDHSGDVRARRLAGLMDFVLCGNTYIADYYSRIHSHVAILPTAVDTSRFFPRPSNPSTRGIVIGWSGGSSGKGNFPDLEPIAPAIAKVLREIPNPAGSSQMCGLGWRTFPTIDSNLSAGLNR